MLGIRVEVEDATVPALEADLEELQVGILGTDAGDDVLRVPCYCISWCY